MGQMRVAGYRIGWPLYPQALGECWWLRGVAVGGGRRGVAEARKNLGESASVRRVQLFSL